MCSRSAMYCWRCTRVLVLVAVQSLRRVHISAGSIQASRLQTAGQPHAGWYQNKPPAQSEAQYPCIRPSALPPLLKPRGFDTLHVSQDSLLRHGAQHYYLTSSTILGQVATIVYSRLPCPQGHDMAPLQPMAYCCYPRYRHQPRPGCSEF